MSIHTAAFRPEAQETAKRSTNRIFLVIAVLLLVGASAAAVLAFSGSQRGNTQTYSTEQLQAMADLRLPGDYKRVDSTWACIANEQSACFTSPSSGLESVEALASAMGAKEYSTRPGPDPFPSSYNFCTYVGSATAQVNVSGLPSNAIQQNGAWVVPPGEEPLFKGTAVTVSLTGPSTCP